MVKVCCHTSEAVPPPIRIGSAYGLGTAYDHVDKLYAAVAQTVLQQDEQY